MTQKETGNGLQYLKAPSGLVTSVEPGWPTTGELWGQKLGEPPMVRVGNVFLPMYFELMVAEKNPEAWAVFLDYFVDKRTREIRLMTAFSTDLEVDDAMERIRKERPMSWWKRHAVVKSTEADMTRLVSQLEGDSPSLQEIETGNLVIARAVDRAKAIPLARRRNRITDSHLRDVAAVYRAAWESGRSPTAAVKDHFRTTHSTAARWVGLARKAGHLGAAVGSRGGEANG